MGKGGFGTHGTDGTHFSKGNIKMTEAKRTTDFGNAERLVENNIDEIRYCSGAKRWLLWRGDRWAFDDGRQLLRKAMETINKITEEAEGVDNNPKLKQALLDHAVRSQTPSKLKAMIFLAQSDPRIQVDLDSLDADPLKLNFLNGTMDLRTKGVHEHSRDDMITKICPVNYDPDATCPLFMSFMTRITGGNVTLFNYIMRIIGYCLTGIITEQVLFIFVGDGANGKSTLLEIIRKILNDYARHIQSSTFLANSKAIRNDLARLNGARFVSSVEMGTESKIDEAMIKQITGGDPITARFLYQEYFELMPCFKLIIAMNQEPNIKGVDHGIWRRIRIVPFDVIIPDEEIDRGLLEKLTLELPGILNWAIQGCLTWQEEGLAVPPEVSIRTEMLKRESDTIGLFLEDCCGTDPDGKIPVKDMFDIYHGWTHENVCDVMTKKSFGIYMKKKGFMQGKSDSVRFWKGVAVKTKTAPSPIADQVVSLQ